MTTNQAHKKYTFLSIFCLIFLLPNYLLAQSPLINQIDQVVSDHDEIMMTSKGDLTLPEIAFQDSMLNFVNEVFSRFYKISSVQEKFYEPAKLSSFKAMEKNCGAELTWATTEGMQFERFEVQRSPDGVYFETLHVEKSFTGKLATKFSFFDKEAFNSNYYRLMMVDAKGKKGYSKIQFVNNSCEGIDFSIYPNPVKSKNNLIGVEFFAPDEESQVEIINIEGEVVYRVTIETEAEMKNIVDISNPSLTPGSYILKVNRSVSRFFIFEE